MTPADELTLAAERLEALDAVATPGPWVWRQPGSDMPGGWARVYQADVDGGWLALTSADVGADRTSNAALIAAMRGVAKPLAALLRNSLSDLNDSYGYHDFVDLAREVIRATGGES
jgi:hypothetical protein